MAHSHSSRSCDYLARVTRTTSCRSKIPTTGAALESYWAAHQSSIPAFRIGNKKWLPEQDAMLLAIHDSTPHGKASTRWAQITHRLIAKTAVDRTITAVRARFTAIVKAPSVSSDGKAPSTTPTPSKSTSPLDQQSTHRLGDTTIDIDAIAIPPAASLKRKQRMATISRYNDVGGLTHAPTPESKRSKEFKPPYDIHSALPEEMEEMEETPQEIAATPVCHVVLAVGDTTVDEEGATWQVRSVDGIDKVTWEEVSVKETDPMPACSLYALAGVQAVSLVHDGV